MSTTRNVTSNHGKVASPGESNGLFVLNTGDGVPDSLPQLWVSNLEEKQLDPKAVDDARDVHRTSRD